ncbi:HEAT repeat domain-containing protein [Borrelia persica]|uniref:HEAT repeat domain-containing protein n=1 Tax=Borrelia persica TaxID=44448 RepID=UPI00046740B2|nr:HEAT repeat domain-containing protein [Borrelia persica]
MRYLRFVLLFCIVFDVFSNKKPKLSNKTQLFLDSKTKINEEKVENSLESDLFKDPKSRDVNLDVKQVNDVISYGLDVQVIEIINSLKKSGDGEYNALLEKRLQKTFNIDLKRAIFDLFLALEYSGGVDAANYILENYESNRYPNDLINLAILYLKKLGDKDSLKKTLISILENKEGNVVAISAYYLGELSSPEYSKEMMDVYDKYSGNDGVKSAILIALGKSNVIDYADRFYEISIDIYENPSIKAAAIKALSYLAPEKITENAHLYLQDNNNNHNVKIAIIEALSRDVSLKSKDILYDFLRDSDVNIRISAVEAIKDHHDLESKEVLIYKIKSDPSVKVREVSGKALVDMGSGYEAIEKIMFDFNVEHNFKFIVFSYLLDKDIDSARLIALNLLDRENIHKPSKLLLSVAMLFASKKGNFDDFYSKIIESKNINLMNLSIKGAVYNKSELLSGKLKEIKKTTNSEYLKKLLVNY